MNENKYIIKLNTKNDLNLKELWLLSNYLNFLISVPDYLEEGIKNKRKFKKVWVSKKIKDFEYDPLNRYYEYLEKNDNDKLEKLLNDWKKSFSINLSINLRKKIYLLEKKIYLLENEIYLLKENEIYLYEENIDFLRKNIYFLGKNIDFLRKNIDFLETYKDSEWGLIQNILAMLLYIKELLGILKINLDKKEIDKLNEILEEIDKSNKLLEEIDKSNKLLRKKDYEEISKRIDNIINKLRKIKYKKIV